MMSDQQLAICPFPVSECSFLVVDLDKLPGVAQDGVWRGAWRVQSYPPPPAKIRYHACQSRDEGRDDNGFGTRYRGSRMEQH